MRFGCWVIDIWELFEHRDFPPEADQPMAEIIGYCKDIVYNSRSFFQTRNYFLPERLVDYMKVANCYQLLQVLEDSLQGKI